jgi:hypothetical protein
VGIDYQGSRPSGSFQVGVHVSWEKWTSVSLGRERVEAKTQASKGFYPGFIMSSEVHSWLLTHAGAKARFFSDGPTGSWHHDIPLSATTVTFYFRDPKVAMLFKLTWG